MIDSIKFQLVLARRCGSVEKQNNSRTHRRIFHVGILIRRCVHECFRLQAATWQNDWYSLHLNKHDAHLMAEENSVVAFVPSGIQQFIITCATKWDRWIRHSPNEQQGEPPFSRTFKRFDFLSTAFELKRTRARQTFHSSLPTKCSLRSVSVFPSQTNHVFSFCFGCLFSSLASHTNRN